MMVTPDTSMRHAGIYNHMFDDNMCSSYYRSISCCFVCQLPTQQLNASISDVFWASDIFAKWLCVQHLLALGSNAYAEKEQPSASVSAGLHDMSRYAFTEHSCVLTSRGAGTCLLPREMQSANSASRGALLKPVYIPSKAHAPNSDGTGS